MLEKGGDIKYLFHSWQDGLVFIFSMGQVGHMGQDGPLEYVAI